MTAPLLTEDVVRLMLSGASISVASRNVRRLPSVAVFLVDMAAAKIQQPFSFLDDGDNFFMVFAIEAADGHQHMGEKGRHAFVDGGVDIETGGRHGAFLLLSVRQQEECQGEAAAGVAK